MTALRLVCNSPEHPAHTVAVTCPACGKPYTQPMHDDMWMCVWCWKPFTAPFNSTPVMEAECNRPVLQVPSWDQLLKEEGDIHKELNYE